jgi:hypothetical protein
MRLFSDQGFFAVIRNKDGAGVVDLDTAATTANGAFRKAHNHDSREAIAAAKYPVTKVARFQVVIERGTNPR